MSSNGEFICAVNYRLHRILAEEEQVSDLPVDIVDGRLDSTAKSVLQELKTLV
jgi:hypothetical protein